MSRYDNDMNGFEPFVTSASEQGSSWRVPANNSSNQYDRAQGAANPASAYPNVYDFETARRLKQEETIASGWRNPYEHAVPNYGDSRANVPVEGLGYDPNEVRVSSSSLVRGSRLTRPEMPVGKPPMDLESYEPSAFDRSKYARKSTNARPYDGAGPAGRTAYEYDSRSVGTSYNSAFRGNAGNGAAAATQQRNSGSFGAYGAGDPMPRISRGGSGPRPVRGAHASFDSQDFEPRSSRNPRGSQGSRGARASYDAYDNYGGSDEYLPPLGSHGAHGSRGVRGDRGAAASRDAYGARGGRGTRGESAPRQSAAGLFGGIAMPSFGFGGGSRNDDYIDAPAGRGSRGSRGGSVRSSRNSRSFQGGAGSSRSAYSTMRDERDEMMEEEEEFAPRRSRLDSLKDKMDKRKRDARHKRADRDFESHVPKDRNQNADQEGGPRAALHKGEMGRSQKKAQRMQLPSVSLPGGFGMPNLGFLSAIPNFFAGSRMKIVGAVAACILLAGILIYPPAQDYYVTMRSNMQMQAELDAINARNAEIQKRIDNLSTDEGVEDKVREELGWVKEGEHAVSVGRDGSSDIGSNAGETSAYVGTGSVRAPETWYSGFLDFFFGYDNSPIEVDDGKDDGSLADDPDAVKDTAADDSAGDSSKKSN